MPTDMLLQNLVSPITLAFLLGVVAALIKSDLEVPEPILKIFAIFLLLSIGLQGGRELAGVSFGSVAFALLATLALVLVLPLTAYLVAHYLVRLDQANAAAVAALYGSVSSVTFIAAQSFAEAKGTPAEGFLAALVAFMEWGILVALFIGRFALLKQSGHSTSLLPLVTETMRGRGFVLLIGGLVMGFLVGESNFKRIEPFFVDLFRGVLVLFLLEMGMAAARQLLGFMKVGPLMVVFGTLVPLGFGVLGTWFGTMAGLSVGGAFVFGAVAASASYIDAPAAVRASLPQANPSIYLTSSLAITFPFNLIVGLPLYYSMALFWQNQIG